MPAHADYPWNEMADVICDETSRREIGIAVTAFPQWLKDMIEDKHGNLAWLHVHADQFGVRAAYPPFNELGEMDHWHGIRAERSHYQMQ